MTLFSFGYSIFTVPANQRSHCDNPRRRCRCQFFFLILKDVEFLVLNFIELLNATYQFEVVGAITHRREMTKPPLQKLFIFLGKLMCFGFCTNQINYIVMWSNTILVRLRKLIFINHPPPHI